LLLNNNRLNKEKTLLELNDHLFQLLNTNFCF
jgi:hypothetical protein